MGTTLLGIPTMQDLAIRAHQSLGGCDVPEDAIAATLDAVVAVYSQEGRGTSPDQLQIRSCEQVAALLPPSKSEGVAAFVDRALRFLAFQYPQYEQAQHERGLLATLFRAHLEEARLHNVATQVQTAETPVHQMVPARHTQLVQYLIKEIERERVRSAHHLAKMHEYLTILEELDPVQARTAVEHLEGELRVVLTATSPEVKQKETKPLVGAGR